VKEKGLLRPAERKRLTEGLAACSECELYLEALGQIGENVEEERKRVAAERNKISGALAIDEHWARNQEQEKPG
jgi:hypothetical protein